MRLLALLFVAISPAFAAQQITRAAGFSNTEVVVNGQTSYSRTDCSVTYSYSGTKLEKISYTGDAAITSKFMSIFTMRKDVSPLQINQELFEGKTFKKNVFGGGYTIDAIITDSADLPATEYFPNGTALDMAGIGKLTIVGTLDHPKRVEIYGRLRLGVSILSVSVIQKYVCDVSVVK